MQTLYKLTLLLLCLSATVTRSVGQMPTAPDTLKTWQEIIKQPVVNYAEAQDAYERALARNPKDDYSHYFRWVAKIEPYLDANGIYDPQRELAIALEARQERDKATANKAQVANWQLLGPVGPPNPTNWNNYSVGRIDCIGFHPTDVNTFYAGSPSGGLWKTTNGGTSWVFLSQSWPSLGVSDIVLDPTNPNIVYVATGDRDSGNSGSFGIQKSSDGGTTWTTLALPIMPYRMVRLLLNPANTSMLLVATSSGVFKSTNSGVSWTLAAGTGSTTSMYDMEYKPGDPSTVYAVTASKFYKSVDGGNSFTEVTGTGINTTTSQRMSLAVSAAAPNQVILASANSTLEGIYRSTDSGNSFTKITSATNSVSASSGNSSITNYIAQTWYTWSLGVSPTNADEIWLGTIAMIKTTDGGSTWQYVNGNVHVDVHALEFQPGTNRLFVGSDGGINRSPASGTGNFDILHNGMSISQMYRLGGVANATGLVYTGLQDNGVVRYDNGINTIQMIGDGMECIIDPTNPSIIYACRQQGSINKSVNGGASWQSIAPSPFPASAAWTIPLVTNPTNPQILLAGYNQVYQSINGGNSWAQAGVMPGTGNVITLRYAPSNSAIIYASRGSNNLCLSSDGGNNWVALTLPTSSYYLYDIAVSSTNASKV